MILGPPPLDKGHPDGAHLGQLVHRLKPVVDRLGQQRGELLVKIFHVSIIFAKIFVTIK